MSDGRIVIDVAANTKELQGAKKAVQDFGKELEGAFQDKSGRWRATNGRFLTMTEQSKVLGNTISETGKKGEEAIGKLDNSTGKAEPGFKKLALSIGAAQLAVKALAIVSNSLGDAITRVDTMNQFPKMMEQLGFSSEDATRSIETLSAGIDGLPTALDTVVSTTQRLALITKDLGESTKLTLALNNAFLASGKGPAEAARGMEQFTQMLSTGKVDMQSWKTLVETMPQALDMVSKSLLGAEAGQAQLYAALRDGDITFQQFTDAIIGANEELAVLAKTGTEGIGTSIANVRTAVVKGVASMIQALDDLSEATTGKGIAGHFNSLKDIVNASFKAITGAVKGATPVVKVLIVTLDLLLKTLKFLSPVIAGVVTSILLLKAVKTVTQYFDAMQVIIKALNGTQTTYLAINKLMTTEAIAGTTAQKALAVGYGLLTGQLSIATVATTAFKGVMTALSGPIGWIIGAISVGVGVFVALKKTLGQTSEEVEALTTSTKEASDATKSLVNSADESAKAFDKQMSSIESNANANRDMIKSLDELTKKEVKTKADRKEITTLVDSLNASITGLNLTYDKESNALNESTKALLARVDAIEKQDKASKTLERLNSIQEEQNEIEEQSKVNKEQLKLAQDALTESGINWFGKNNELKESVEALEASEQSLTETKKSLATEYQLASEQYAQALADQEMAIQAYVDAHGVSYDILNDKQKTVVDNMKSKFTEYRDAAVDMFGQIEDTMMGTNDAGEEYVKSSSEIYNELITNLQHNQTVLETLETNMNSLRDRFAELGLDTAILEQLAELGPEAAPYIQALADSSDTELSNLSETFASGGETAKDAFFAAFGVEESELPEGFANMITNMEASISAQIEEADFKSLMEPAGADLVAGAVQGVEENAESLNTATSDLAQGAENAFKEEAGIHSPSTVFETLAAFLIDGAVIGVVNNTHKLVTAVSELAKKAVKPFQDIRSDFETAGRNAGISFENGLASREGNIVATARRIAQRASSAINNSLTISGGTTSRASSGGVARAMTISEEPQLATMATMAAMPMLATAQLPRIDAYSATGGYEYSERNSAQSSVNNSRQLKETQAVANQTLGVLKDLVDISERGFKRQIIAQSFIDKKNISEELNEPLQSVQRSNENINKLLRGEWT